MLKRDFLILFVISLLIRVALFMVISVHPEKYYSDSDSHDYEDIALNMMDHGAFSDDTIPPYTPDLYRTPTYPVLITIIYSLTGRSVSAVIMFHVLVGALSAALMIPLADALNLSRRVGWLAGIVLAIDPLIDLTTFQLITETVFVDFLLLAVFLLAIYFKKKDLRWLAGSAVLFGIASLTRPIDQYLPVALLPLFFIAGGKLQFRDVWKGAVMFLVVSMVVTYSWAYRNYSQAHLWTLSAIGDVNLLYYRAMEVVAEEEDLSEDEALAQLEQEVAVEVESGHLDRAQEIEFMHDKAIGIFLQYPLTTFKVHALGFVKVIANPGFDLVCIMLETQNIEFDAQGNMNGCSSSGEDGLVGQIVGKLSQMNWLEKSVAVLEMVILAGLYLGSAIAVWKLLRDRRWFLLYFLLVPVAYFSVLSAGGESVSRFRIPFIPFLAILMGIAFTEVYFHADEKLVIE